MKIILFKNIIFVALNFEGHYVERYTGSTYSFNHISSINELDFLKLKLIKNVKLIIQTS